MKEKLRWWRRFWPLTLIACSALIVLDGVLYLLGYTDLSQLLGVILAVFAGIPVTYGVWYLQTRYQSSKKMQLINKIAFIGTGGFVAWVITFFGGALIIWATGLPPPAAYLGPEMALIILFVAPWIVGGFVGYLVGKRRNFRPFM